MRGKPSASSTGAPLAGLIPAHAGKTSSFSWLLRRSAAHPRSREENTTKKRSVPIRTGSSPLTRGKRHDPGPELPCGRLIPAHAGKTEGFGAGVVGVGSHPPLTRGKRGVLLRALSGPGLIPTHAGTTKCRTPSGHPRQAHPHSRGENHSFREGNTRTQGSSPLTRGKRGVALRVPRYGGLIPTHAGKTPH